MTEFFCIHFPKKNVKLETRCVIAVWYNKQLPRLVSFFIIKLSIVIFQAIGTKKLGIDICLIASKYCKCEWIRGPWVFQDTRTLSAFTVHKIFSVGAHSPTIDYFRSCGFLSWLWTVLLPLKSIVDIIIHHIKEWYSSFLGALEDRGQQEVMKRKDYNIIIVTRIN